MPEFREDPTVEASAEVKAFWEYTREYWKRNRALYYFLWGILILQIAAQSFPVFSVE